MTTDERMIHLGPLRRESLELHQRLALPVTLISPYPIPPSGSEHAALADLQQVRALVAPQSGEATRYHYNLPGFDSLAPATGLQALYPGLRETRRQPVETCTLAEVLHEQGILAVTHLVLEQPDSALALLQAWQEEGLLEQLQRLHVRTSPESLYRGMATQAELCAWCEQQGWELEAESELEGAAEDPEFALLGFKRNALYAPLQEARQQAQALQTELAERQAQRDEYKALLEQNAKQLQEAAEALRESEAALQQRAEVVSALQKERDTLKQERDKLKQQRDEQAKASEAAQAERDALKQERDQLKQQCDEHAKAKEAAQAEREALKQEHDQLKQQCDEQTQAREAALAEREALKQERDKLKQQRDEQAKAREAVQAERDTLKQERDQLKQQRDEQAKASEAAHAEREVLKQERDKIKQQRDEQSKAREAAQAERDALKEERDTFKQERETLKQQRDEQAKAKEAAQAEREALKQERDTLKQERDKLKQQRDEQTQAKEAAQTERDALKQKRNALEQQLATANASLEAQQAHNRQLQKLQERMEYLFEQQTLQREQAANALGQHVTRQTHATIDSVQTCIEAQKALGASGQALSYDGKSLPHASALLLNRTLENGSYDVVLDIGTGVTTAFLASTLQQRGAEQRRIAQRHRSGSSESADGQLEAYTVAEAGELPKRLQAFTHSREQGQAMRDHLQRKGLEPLAGVHLAPLVEVATAGQTALFYDLARPLQRLADLFDERSARVLVVCALEQQPASASVEALLPLLLQHLASHTLELVMLGEPEAQQATELQTAWVDCLQARELSHDLKEDARSRAWTLTING